MERFRGSWAPRVDDARIETAAAKTKVAVKLVREASVRLVECELTMNGLREKTEEIFGMRDATLTYQIPGDDDLISIVDDGDLVLAANYGGSPLRVLVQESTATPAMEDDPFTIAEKELANQGLEAPADQIELLLRVLDLRPRRLVKHGLAPPSSLKYDQDKQWENVDRQYIVHAKQVVLDEEDVVVVESEGDERVEKVDDEVKREQEQEEEEEDQVVRVLREKGIVRIEPSTLHALLRILDVPPNRFVKLGLVKNLKEARNAYKTGGAKAAQVVCKDSKKHLQDKKKWGRGLCGGRGMARGKGWNFHQHAPPFARGGHRHRPSPFDHFGVQWHPYGEHRRHHPPPHFYGHHHHHHHGGPPPHFRGAPRGPPPPFRGCPSAETHGPPPPFHGPPPPPAPSPCKGKCPP